MFILYFLFFKQKTAYEMRISDWSSDVCSSDLYAIDHAAGVAVFSIFRHAAERPAFAIAKIPTPRGPDFAVFDDKRKLRRSTVLTDALRAFDKRLRLVTE